MKISIILTIIILALLFLGFILFGFNFVKWRDPYGCDIGENDIAGDYKLTKLTLSRWYDRWFNERSCAIEDCSAYNKYQKEIGSKLRCVVIQKFINKQTQ